MCFAVLSLHSTEICLNVHWTPVLLSPSWLQVNHILACAELYFSCRAKLQNEQRVLQQHLKATAAATEGMLLSGESWLCRLGWLQHTTAAG
jgi:hypothetical protein